MKELAGIYLCGKITSNSNVSTILFCARRKETLYQRRKQTTGKSTRRPALSEHTTGGLEVSAIKKKKSLSEGHNGRLDTRTKAQKTKVDKIHHLVHECPSHGSAVRARREAMVY